MGSGGAESIPSGPTESARFIDRIDQRWENIRALFYGFRVAWVSSLSVLLGMLMLLLAPQAQDLFLEVRGSRLSGILFWVAFYLAVLVGWVLPVTVSATWILHRFRRDGRHTHRVAPVEDWVRRLVPPMLAMGCFAAVSIGQTMAVFNGPEIFNAEFEVRRHRMLIPIPFKLTVFLVYLSVIVAALWLLLLGPVRRIARRWLRSALFVLWLIVAVGLLIPVAGAVFLAVVTAMEQSHGELGLDHIAVLPLVTAGLGAALWIIWMRVRTRWDRRKADPRASADIAAQVAFAQLRYRSLEVLFFCLLAMELAIFLFQSVYLHPVEATQWLRRAHLIPFYMAFLAPLVTWLSYWSFRARAPLVLFIIVFGSVLTEVLFDAHNVRVVETKAARPGLEQSIRDWRAANGCEADVKSCPRPIIVATAGGGSRAAFHTAGLLGRLLDDSIAVERRFVIDPRLSRLYAEQPRHLWTGLPPDELPIALKNAVDPKANPSPLRSFADQLFAISAVSGGALGAVTYYSALADSRLATTQIDAGLKPPCKKDAADADYFRSQLGGAEAARADQKWRHCLQQITSGDFLSPVFASLMGPDLFEIDQRGNRAVYLEQAWEARYARLLGQDVQPSLRVASAKDTNEKASTLYQSMIELRTRIVTPGSRRWLPVLLLNGTSVATGRRIITSDLDPFLRDAEGKPVERLFRDAYDMHELMQMPVPGQGDSQALTPADSASKSDSAMWDVRLSTAASSSARFPIISPHGDIRRQRDGSIVDRVVDGGYHENFGAMTALEVAREIPRLVPGLKPFIILVANEPTTPNLDCHDRQRAIMLGPSLAASWGFTTLLSPLDALWQTRSARGTHAAAQLCDVLREHGEDSLAFVGVNPKGINPPVSWWLSKHVQKYLDDQLESIEVNGVALDRITKLRMEKK